MSLQLPSADPQPLERGLRRTDAFHRQPLFLVEPVAGSSALPNVVRSWNEAHALHGPARPEDVNPAYVAALISGDPSADAAPYRRIRRLPRAHQVVIGADGGLDASPYDPLAGGASAMDAEALHRFLREGLLDHVRLALAGHNGPIGCEHSSGLDSNAVLGAVVHGVGVQPSRLHTWSLEGGGEGQALEQFRPFFGLLPEQCHRITPAAPTPEYSVGLLQHQLEVYGAPAQICSDHQVVTQLRQQGCTLVFSGFGGDQALSHNANNVPTDLVAQGRWQELIRWMGGRRLALKTAGGRALALTHRPWAMARVRQRSLGFCRSDLLKRALTADGRAWLDPHLRETYPWEIDGYLPQHVSIRRRVLADWVAVRAEEERRMAVAHGMVKAFPLLDERLIGTLLQQDPALFGEGIQRGRLLHRRAFAPFLPPFLRDNPTKDRAPEGGIEQWEVEMVNRHRMELEQRLQAAGSWHADLARWWDLAAIRQEIETLLACPDASLLQMLGRSKDMAILDALSAWWHALAG